MARFRFLPPASLSAFNTECEAGLEHLIYLACLINDETETVAQAATGSAA